MISFVVLNARHPIFSSVDLVLLDRTGPIRVTLLGDDLVNTFIQQVNNAMFELGFSITGQIVQRAETRSRGENACCIVPVPHQKAYGICSIFYGILEVLARQAYTATLDPRYYDAWEGIPYVIP